MPTKSGDKVRKKKETTTANIAQFQHKLGGDPDEGFKDEEEFEEYYKKYKTSKKKKKAVKEGKLDMFDDPRTTQTDREDSRIGGGWSYEKPSPRCLKGEVWDDEQQKCVPQIEEGIFNRDVKFKELKYSDGFEVFYKGTMIGRLISLGLSLQDIARTKQLNWKFFPVDDKGKTVKYNTATFYNPKDAKKMISKDPMLYAQYAIKEGTVSGQGASASPRVAGTDTRFGGPSFEPVFFDEDTPENDAIRNEKVFYNDNNDPVLLPGWTYAEDLADYRFSDQEVETPELLDDGDEDSGINRKEKTGISWELDFDGKYKQLLQRLRKLHNI